MGLFDRLRGTSRATGEGELLGCWHLVRSDADPEATDHTEMEFFADGRLDYAIDVGDRWQIMHLTYRVDRGRIVTDQPSAPGKTSTKFKLLADGSLLLDLNGERSWYRRGERRAPAV